MGLFFKDRKPPVQKISERIQANASPVDIATVKPVDVSIVDTDYNKTIDNLIESSDQQGFDYLEFSKNITNDLPLTEEQKYKAAGHLLNTMKLTPSSIIDSAGYYVRKLDEYKDKFDRSMASAKEEQISKKMESIASKQKLIQQLTIQIQEESANIQKLTLEVDGSNTKLKAHEAAFNSAVNKRKETITQHINNIKTYLQNDKPA